MAYPILYTFRRCPYAIRARMALAYSQIRVQQQEVDLKNKPQDMLKSSAKGTVPVLLLEDDSVIDESIDIIFWSLTQSDPDRWLSMASKEQCDDLIHRNDTEFKPILDNYKYAQNLETHYYYRDKAKEYLHQLNVLLMNNRYLLAAEISVADIAVFPFIRQFYMVDKHWLDHSEYKHLHAWLHSFLNSALFLRVMEKNTLR